MKREMVSRKIRDKIALRAQDCCEYCLLPQMASFYVFHIEHIKPKKHGGKTTLENLAYSCPDCNYHKGTDIGTYLDESEDFMRFFNPRRDHWHTHFLLRNDGVIESFTPIGEATARVFGFNHVDRLIFRRELIALGAYSS